MFKYRVLSYKSLGNGLKLYTILNTETNETFEARGGFFREHGDKAFVNVRVKNGNFNILKKDKAIENNTKLE